MNTIENAIESWWRRERMETESGQLFSYHQRKAREIYDSEKCQVTHT